MTKPGRTLSEKEIQKIINLLSATEMTIGEIGKRMGCSRSAVTSLNRKYCVRDYAGLRTKWTLQSTGIQVA
jgi:DNA-directed RNA polymerase specialized sigma subunit